MRCSLALVTIFLMAAMFPPHSLGSEVLENLHCDIGKQLNLPVTEWVDKTQPVKATFIAVHGLTLYAGAFNAIANHLATNGYRVYALDMRGFGRWIKEGSQYGGDTNIHIGLSQTDLLSLVRTIRHDNPGQTILFLGESQGTNLAMWVVENFPSETEGAILFSPCYHMRSHPSPEWIIDFFREVAHPDKPLNLEPYTRPYLTNDPALTEKCDNDPLVNRTMTPAELVKCALENRRAIRNAKLLPKDYPILLIAGAQDAVFKTKGLPKEVKKFGDAENVQLTILPGKGHLLIEHQPLNPEIGSLIDRWLERQHANVSRDSAKP